MQWKRVPVVLAAVVALAAAGCESAQPRPPNPPPAPLPAAPAAPPAAVTAEPPPDVPSGPVLAVKIDNAKDARPPVGLGAAEMVFVEPVEGGLSRLLAVFSENKPGLVGPVRSARETDLQLLPQFGHPTLAFSGAAPDLLPLVDQAPVQNASDAKVPGAYTRNKSREAPHNLFVHPNQLPPGGAWPPSAALPFGPAPEGGERSNHRKVDYEAATVEFDWSDEHRQWRVSMDGQPYATDTGPLAPGTVVIQQVGSHNSPISDAAGMSSPVAETVGSGQAEVLRDGLAFDVNWSRPNPESPTTYTTSSGEPMHFAPGQVWVVLTHS